VIGITVLPRNVYEFLYKFKSYFRCKQSRHFVLFCWFVVMLSIDQGRGKIKGLSRIMPQRIKYWALMRMIRSGQWGAQELLQDMVWQVLLWLPPACDGVVYLIGDTTLKGKRGKKHPLGRKARMNDLSGYTFGFEMVILIAAWGRYRIVVAVRLIDPKRRGHQNILFRQMIRDFVAPKWARKVVVIADGGFAANKTFKTIGRKKYGYVFAISRTRKFSDGKHVSDLVRHLPKSYYRRIASYRPDGRRKDYWIYSRRVWLNGLGNDDVTMILSKRRRNEGPKKIKIIVTNLCGAKECEILSIYARRWGIEVTIKELKGGLHIGQMQVTKDAKRVEHSVVLSVVAYLLLVRLYGRKDYVKEEFSIFKLKQKFIADVYQGQLNYLEQKWREKLNEYRAAA
jgi:hypothetical protein